MRPPNLEGHQQEDILTDQSPLGIADQCDYCQFTMGTGVDCIEKRRLKKSTVVVVNGPFTDRVAILQKFIILGVGVEAED